MTSVGLCSTYDVIAFDQNWHHLYSSSAEGKDLSSDTQIRVIRPITSEICTKTLHDVSEKLPVKFPVTAPSYSMVKIARLDGAFSEILELEASPSRKSITATKR